MDYFGNIWRQGINYAIGSQTFGAWVKSANDADLVKLTGDQTVAGNKTFTGSFNYSAIASGTDNVARPVWFSQDNSTNKGKPVVNVDQLTFNPNTKVLKVGDSSSSTVSFGDKVKLQWNSTTASLDFNFV